ncbi:MAG: hypothetical protein MI867_07140 [Pseudomonadales bacterium]|nr:hypothetical protein [Pseudomonadales bacterium]
MKQVMTRVKELLRERVPKKGQQIPTQVVPETRKDVKWGMSSDDALRARTISGYK